VWLILPLIYVLGWKQTGSLRQAFNGTVAWIFGYAAAAGTILILDVGGYDGVIRATPDSPGAALAILGGFVGMWISNILWRRRGGDPPREPGRWERAFRAMISGEKQSKKKRKSVSGQSQPQQPPVPQAPPQQQPVDAQYRPAPGYQNAPMQPQAAQPQYSAPAAQARPVQAQQPPVQQPRPARKQSRRSPTADKYAKATGRALGAMFRGSKKKKS
jgi:hypothetical protein